VDTHRSLIENEQAYVLFPVSLPDKEAFYFDLFDGRPGFLLFPTLVV